MTASGFKYISDGWLFSPNDIVSGLAQEKVLSLAPLNDTAQFQIPVNNFLFRTNKELVLIDTGAGNTMQPTMGKLHANLVHQGISPADINYVVLTHLHPDHANGLIDENMEAVYPNATLVIPEIELDFWLATDPGTEPENVARNRRRTPHNLAPYHDRIIRARDGKEIIGLTPMLAPGHTPGHTIWFGNSGEQRFAAWGDLVHLAAVQLPHPEAAVMYDLDKAASAATRKRVLDMLSADDVLILGAHLDTPGPGRLLRRGAGYVIEPVPGGLIAG